MTNIPSEKFRIQNQPTLTDKWARVTNGYPPYSGPIISCKRVLARVLIVSSEIVAQVKVEIVFTRREITDY